MDTTAKQIRNKAYRLLQSMEVDEADTRSDPTNDWSGIDAAGIRSKARRLLEAVDNREDTDRAMIEEDIDNNLSSASSSIPQSLLKQHCTQLNDGQFLCNTSSSFSSELSDKEDARSLLKEATSIEYQDFDREDRHAINELEMNMSMMMLNDNNSSGSNNDVDTTDWGWANNDQDDNIEESLGLVDQPLDIDFGPHISIDDGKLLEQKLPAANNNNFESPVANIAGAHTYYTTDDEVFPLVLGTFLIVTSLIFTMYTIMTVCNGRREDDCDNTTKVTDSIKLEEKVASNIINMNDDTYDAFMGVVSSPSFASSCSVSSHGKFVDYLNKTKKAQENQDTPGVDTDSDTSSEKESKEREDCGIVSCNSWVYGRRPSSEEIDRHGSLSLMESVEEDDIESGGEEARALLSWKDLSCSYPSKKKTDDDITTLSDVTGKIEYKELVAIMGPSGGGKSTLMDILSGRKSLGNLTGEMSLLGETMSPKSNSCQDILRNVVAYVPQNEQFFPNQTPEEAVAFAANLKLGKDERGDKMRKKRIDQTLDLVGIPLEARKRPIGGVLAGGMVIRGLSGGERKRLALACAVAMRPSLLFFDEITSGLDSENAVLVIDLIKKMCKNMNVAAVVVIHQPSYEVFSYFDRLILLSKGKCVYSDKLDSIQSFYNRVGRSMPEKYLLPNDILNIASNWDKYEHEDTNTQTRELAKTCGQKLLQDIKSRKKPSTWLQFKTVLNRQLINHYVRNLTNLFARVLIFGLTALLLGAVFWKIAETENDESLSFEQAKASFGAGIFITQVFYLLPFAQISTFFFDKNLFATESSIGLYPAWIYSSSQILLELWVMVLCALVESAIAVPMIGLWNPSSSSKFVSFITMFSVFCVSGACGNAITMLTSILMFSQDLTFLVGAACTVVFLAVSGGFVPFPFMQNWIVWLQWISPIKYSFQGFNWALLRGTYTATILEQLELDTPASVTSNLCILIGVFILCASASVLALSRQKEVR